MQSGSFPSLVHPPSIQHQLCARTHNVHQVWGDSASALRELLLWSGRQRLDRQLYRRPAVGRGGAVSGCHEKTEQRTLTQFRTEKACPRGDDTCAEIYREDHFCLTVTMYFFLFPYISYGFCFMCLCFFVVKVSNGLRCLSSLRIVPSIV